MFFSINKTRLQSPPKHLFVCLWCNRSFEHREEQEIGFWGKNSFLFCFSWSRSKISFFVKMGERPKMDFELFGHLPEKDWSVSNFFLNLLQNWDQKILFGSHKTWIFLLTQRNEDYEWRIRTLGAFRRLYTGKKNRLMVGKALLKKTQQGEASTIIKSIVIFNTDSRN